MSTLLLTRSEIETLLRSRCLRVYAGRLSPIPLIRQAGRSRPLSTAWPRPVTHDYKAYDNKFTGAIRKIVIGVGPVGEAFDPPLEWNGVG